jgi:hypothetical protein
VRNRNHHVHHNSATSNTSASEKLEKLLKMNSNSVVKDESNANNCGVEPTKGIPAQSTLPKTFAPNYFGVPGNGLRELPSAYWSGNVCNFYSNNKQDVGNAFMNGLSHPIQP